MNKIQKQIEVSNDKYWVIVNDDGKKMYHDLDIGWFAGHSKFLAFESRDAADDYLNIYDFYDDFNVVNIDDIVSI